MNVFCHILDGSITHVSLSNKTKRYVYMFLHVELFYHVCTYVYVYPIGVQVS